jgi:hypothetical protein
MKKLLILLSVVFCLGTKGQTNVYQPWPADSAVWLLEYYPIISGPNPTPYYSKTVWLGDTIINTKTYIKLFSSNGFSSSSYTYTGGVRQDIPNEKLYKIGTSGSEYEVFNNQHLLVGDTFPCFVNNGKITNIDSVLIGAKYHKQYNDTSMIMYGISRRYIVGFGSMFEAANTYYYNILCFSIDNINRFSGCPPICQLPTNTIGVEQHNANNEIDIYPNPTNNYFKIKTNTPVKLNADLFDVNGRHVFSKTIVGTTDIDASTLDNGVYTLTIKSSSGIANKKLVIAR